MKRLSLIASALAVLGLTACEKGLVEDIADVSATSQVTNSVLQVRTRSGGMAGSEADSPGADYFVKKRIDQIMRLDPQIDTLILGCTHYPLLMPKILKYLPDGVRVVPQGEYVADSLAHYLERHPQIEQKCSKGATAHYLTTENPDKFKEQAQIFLHEPVEVENTTLE